VTNASTGLAVSSDSANTIQSANAYYFSWAQFITSIILLVNYLRHAFGILQNNNRGARLSLWAAMLASALVVMGSCSRILSAYGLCDVSSSMCHRIKFGVATGTLGVFFSLTVLFKKMVRQTETVAIEGALAFLLAVFNAFGVAFLTSTNGPASSVSNLYYFAWSSFLCSAFLLAECYLDYLAAQDQHVIDTDSSDSDDKGDGATLTEVPLEIDDTL
jgi:hypothetical protein